MGLGGSLEKGFNIDGGTDNTPIGNISDRLKVDVSSLNSKLRVEFTTATISITSTVTYTTLYSYTGSGALHGFHYEFNSTDVVPRLIVDGEIILDALTISQYNAFTVTSNSIARRQSGSGIVTAGSTFDFSFKFPIYFTTSITIDARNGSSSPHNFNQGAVYISKVT